MTIYLSDRTGASIDSVLDNADAGNIGKTSINNVSNLDALTAVGFYPVSNGATAQPVSDTGHVIHSTTTTSTGSLRYSQTYIAKSSRMFFRISDGANWQSWQELYHTGNTGFTAYAAGTPTQEETRFDTSAATIRNFRPAITLQSHLTFHNPNGQVGGITSTGTATAYNTSSDPRLKDFAEAPTDLSINTEFDKLFSCFRTFNWKSDPDGDLVWGFDAHKCIDNGTNVGSEGEGPRNLSLGEVYNTTPAVYEDQEQPVIYKSGDKIGQPRLDSDGEPFMETVSVEVEAAIEHKVTPAGVDQSKAVPILLAKIEQLERRLTAAGI